MAKADLEKIISSALPLEYRLWGVEYLEGRQTALLRIYIDSDNGINLDDCERASGQISALLDVHDPISGEYELEISSPGLERVFFNLAQLKNYLGQKIRLVLYQAIEKKRRFSAVLLDVNEAEDAISVKAEDGSELTLAFRDIAKVNLVYDFEGGKKHGK